MKLRVGSRYGFSQLKVCGAAARARRCSAGYGRPVVLQAPSAARGLSDDRPEVGSQRVPAGRCRAAILGHSRPAPESLGQHRE